MKTLGCWLLLPLVSSVHVWNYDDEGRIRDLREIISKNSFHFSSDHTGRVWPAGWEVNIQWYFRDFEPREISRFCPGESSQGDAQI